MLYILESEREREGLRDPFNRYLIRVPETDTPAGRMTDV